jgi:8-oxo-dGTP diphosphatase
VRGSGGGLSGWLKGAGGRPVADIVNGLLLQKGQILMARRSRNRANYPDCWSFPGGHVEEGETLEQALARELNEEIGIIPVAPTFLTSLQVCPAGSSDTITFHLFSVKDWQGQLANLGDEHSELRWMHLDQASELPDLAFDAYEAVFATLKQ